MNPVPPSILRRLLAWALPPGRVRDGLLGDLDELYAERVRGNRTSARLWYARQLVSVAVRYPPRRLWAGGLHWTRKGMLEGLSRDLGYAFRMLRRGPGFAAIVVLTLALGIGANTAIFSIVKSVVLQPLAYPEPERLMRLRADFPDLALQAVSAREYLEFREINRSFSAVGGVSTGSGLYTTGEVNITAGNRPLRVRSVSVDAHLLDALGVHPTEGRLFDEEETALGMGGLASPIAILSYELWQRAFDGQPLLGQTVNVNGRAHEIVGIMPPDVDVLDNRTELWLPLGLVGALRDNRNFHTLGVIGRLRDGVTPEAAQAELEAFLADWRRRTGASGHVPTSFPSLAGEHSLQLQPLQTTILGDAARSLWMLQLAAAFILLIACVNLANLLLARGETRRREFAVRAALGAGRARLFRQATTEGVLLAGAGGALGLGLAKLAVEALVREFPSAIPRMGEVAIDVPALMFAFCVSVGAGVLFGLAPAAQRRIGDLVTALKEGGDRSVGSRGRHHVRRALVTAQIALSVTLVIGAGLLIRTVHNLRSVDGGFDRAPVITFSVTFPEPYEPDTRALAYQRLLQRLQATPGVQGAAFMSGLPPHRSPEAIRTAFENYTAADGSDGEVIDYYQLVMGEYFETMGIPIVAGRGFERNDAGSRDKVVVVNERLADRIWGTQDPIGQRVGINYGAFGFGGSAPHTVIGVAKDVKQGGVDQDTGTELYVSLEQIGLAAPTMNAVLRTTLRPSELVGTLQRLVREVDPAVPIVRLRDMESVFAESIRRPTLLTYLLGVFAALALLLAAVGTYGVLSYMVTQRRREVGIRIALGARRADVFALVLGQGLQLTVIGIALGVAGAFGLTRLIASVLFGVEPTDLATLTAVIATITLVATIACGLPAWRAARLDPNVMLSSE